MLGGFRVLATYRYTLDCRGKLKTCSGKTIKEAATVSPSERRTQSILACWGLVPSGCSLLITFSSCSSLCSETQNQQWTCSTCNIKQAFLLLNCALALFNRGASFWILVLGPVDMGTDPARTYKDRVVGEENSWAKPLPSCPSHKH